MLEYCNICVAMGSGGDEIKAMADYVTDAVDDDGLYNAFILINNYSCRYTRHTNAFSASSRNCIGSYLRSRV